MNLHKQRGQHPACLQVPFHFFNRLLVLASRIENRSRQASTPDGQFVLDDVWDTILTPSRKNVEKVPLLGFHQLLTIWRYFSKKNDIQISFYKIFPTSRLSWPFFYCYSFCFYLAWAWSGAEKKHSRNKLYGSPEAL